MKRFLKVLLWIFITFFLLSAGMVIFVQSNSKTLVNELKKQLNKYLLTEVQINEIHISSFKHFPNITVVMDQVVVKEVPKESGLNLAELKNIYMVINLFDFIRKDYIIQKVVCSDGKINIRRYLDNTYNYDVWKVTTSDSVSSDVEFKINRAIFQHIDLSFNDQPYKYSFTTFVDKCDLKGNLTKSPYSMFVHSKTRNLKLKVHDKNFDKEDLVEFQTVLDYDTDNEIFQIHQSKLWIDENKIEIDGSYIYYFKSSQSRMDLVFKAKSLSYKTVFDYLPDTYKSKFKDYALKGDLSFKAVLKGVYDSKHFPAINIDFQTNNTDITSKTDNFAVNGISLRGSFSNRGKSNPSSFSFSIPEFSAKIEKNNITGSLVFQNFNDPYLNFNFKSKINSISLNPFMKDQGILFDSGYIDADISYKGKLAGLKTLQNEQSLNAKILLENVGFKDKTGNKIEALTGNIQIKGNQISITNLNTKLNESNLKFNGNFEGLIPYFLNNTKNVIGKGNLEIDKLDFSEDKNGNSKNNQTFMLPDLSGINCDINTKIEEFNLPGFSATKVKGDIKFRNGRIISNNLNFNTSSGNIAVNGMLTKSVRNELTFEGRALLSNIDLTRLFIQFQNFGQNNLTDKNLKGTADADIELIISFDSAMNFIEPSLYALADITISNGELINYQTIQNLLGFIKLKKMDHIKFDKMQNTIIIKDRRIDIPKMTLKSSAFNMDIQGWHTFDNKIEYNMKINLTQLFFGKNKIEKTDIENGEDDTKGGINLYVTMYGDVYNPQFKFNKGTVKSKVNDGIGNQKKEMKEILQKKKDEKNGNNNKQNNNNDFELEWDDN